MRILPAAAAVIALLLGLAAHAQENPQSTPVYREGVHYTELAEPVAVEVPNKIEVTEVFWYGCGHCFQFEPRVLKWKEDLPEDVNFVQIPAIWSRPMEAHARAYYTAAQLGILDQVHQAVYNALHIDRNPLNNPEAVAALFADFGADEAKAVEVFNSSQVTALLREADAKARGYQITGTPQLVVNGRYRIEASQQVPQSEMFNVVDFLVERVRAEK
ncbi:MAG: thiol:disulfide interchange protein DsbA/DsbL [Cellvibrionaceae bacterium]